MKKYFLRLLPTSDWTEIPEMEFSIWQIRFISCNAPEKYEGIGLLMVDMETAAI